MQVYKVIVAYDGTAYHGWQKQKDQLSVAGVLEQKFHKVFGQTISLCGASRTDAGVHALGQVATFSCPLVIDSHRLRSAWNGQLPPDILIRSIEPVSENFHAQHDVISKTYWYQVSLHRSLPSLSRFVTWYRFPFEHEKLAESLQCFVGTHDFRSFCTGDEQDTTVRTVTSICIESSDEFAGHRIVVKGPGFLRYMIRRIVGAGLYVASHPSFAVADILRVLHAKNPCHTFPTALAKGLVLAEIEYI